MTNTKALKAAYQLALMQHQSLQTEESKAALEAAKAAFEAAKAAPGDLPTEAEAGSKLPSEPIQAAQPTMTKVAPKSTSATTSTAAKTTQAKQAASSAPAPTAPANQSPDINQDTDPEKKSESNPDE